MAADDLPEVEGFTIDHQESRDLDDAIWIDKVPEGFVATVSVTAVSLKVEPGSERDERALSRVETSYGRRGNRPMLPRWLADEKASLLPGQRRVVLSTRVKLGPDLCVRGSEVALAVLMSAAKLAHADVPRILADPKHEMHAQVSLCAHVAEGLMERRRAAGAFVFYDLNHGWVTTEEGHVRRLKDTTETIGYVVVQELMILANAALAELCASREIPVPFRNHTAKAHAPAREEIMQRLAAGLHEPLRGLEALQKQVNLVMNRADYGVELKGHYGLNLPAYVHCTSPIRRYADLLTQRQLVAHVQDEPLPHSREEVARLSATINSIIQANREATREYQTEQAASRAKAAVAGAAVAGDVDLAKLGDKEFERVAKVVLRGDEYVPALTWAYRDRMAAEVVTTMDLYLGLLENMDSCWAPLRQLVVDHLAQRPNLAPGIASMAMNIQDWSEISFDETDEGPPHLRTFTVRARATIRDAEGRRAHAESSTATGSTLKVARQRAIVSLLCRAAGVPEPDWETPSVAVATAEVVPVPEPGDNPVSALQEYAQKLNVPVPVYAIERAGGEAHAPTFTGRCSFQGTSTESVKASNKRAAKKAAAEAMIQHLREHVCAGGR